MAAGDLTPYNSFKLSLLDGNDTVDFDTDTIKVGILKTSHTPSTGDAGDVYWDDVSADQVATGTGYSTGGPTLASVTLVLASGVVTFDAADITVSQDVGTGFTDGSYIVIYKDTGTPATSPLIYLGDLGTARNSQAGIVEIKWGVSGIFDLT
jgi:hypothetical protein